MLKRQESTLLSSSSRRRENTTENRHEKANIGCMAGVFQLFSKYQNRRRFLTFGRKPEKKDTNKVPSSASKPKPSPGNQASSSTSSMPIRDKNSSEVGRFSSVLVDLHRSPTLPADIRQSNPLNSLENFPTIATNHRQNSPAVVARLMGLEDIVPSAAEKRRKLLGALEKCDEDLKALKKIIEAVQSADLNHDHLPSPPRAAAMVNRVRVEEGGGASPRPKWGQLTVSGEVGESGGDGNGGGGGEQPSPVSVLDDFNRFSSRRHSHAINGRTTQQQKQKPQFVKKAIEEDNLNVCLFIKDLRAVSYGSKCDTAMVSSPLWAVSSPLWTSKAMMESVDEVCRDIAWGEKREVGRIGLALQDYICRDLIEEIVKELGDCYNCMFSLPLEACKKRLRF